MKKSDQGDFPIWSVAALCLAVADAMNARFNPVWVRGEVSNFTKASSGHCYFAIKDEHAQLRCAMFRRAAETLNFVPQTGDLLELHGHLGVYEPRGELQLVVEYAQKSGQGAWFEQFLYLKNKLQAQGLFDANRKRKLPTMPRAIAVVTSQNAAAWHDVMTALRRRAAHIPVVLSSALVQGANAPLDLIRALQAVYRLIEINKDNHQHNQNLNNQKLNNQNIQIDVILLVRGGGAAEDLQAFNDENLAHILAQSPVPIISGIGHETDFTIADFIADFRAPTPTAAAELAADSQLAALEKCEQLRSRLNQFVNRYLDKQNQHLDQNILRLNQSIQKINEENNKLKYIKYRLQQIVNQQIQKHQNQLDQMNIHLNTSDPNLILKRGFVYLSDENQNPISSINQIQNNQKIKATLKDGFLDLNVIQVNPLTNS